MPIWSKENSCDTLKSTPPTPCRLSAPDVGRCHVGLFEGRTDAFLRVAQKQLQTLGGPDPDKYR